METRRSSDILTEIVEAIGPLPNQGELRRLLGRSDYKGFLREIKESDLPRDKKTKIRKLIRQLIDKGSGKLD